MITMSTMEIALMMAQYSPNACASSVD